MSENKQTKLAQAKQKIREQEKVIMDLKLSLSKMEGRYESAKFIAAELASNMNALITDKVRRGF